MESLWYEDSGSAFITSQQFLYNFCITGICHSPLHIFFTYTIILLTLASCSPIHSHTHLLTDSLNRSLMPHLHTFITICLYCRFITVAEPIPSWLSLFVKSRSLHMAKKQESLVLDHDRQQLIHRLLVLDHDRQQLIH